MKVMGLDISSVCTGWAILKNGRFYSREGIDYGTIQPPKNVQIAGKLSYFRDALVLLLERNKPDVIGIEDAFFFKNPKTLKVLSEFRGVALETSSTVLGVDPNVVSVREIRTILGTQDKKASFLSIVELFKLKNWDFENSNDITDALAVAYYVYKKK